MLKYLPDLANNEPHPLFPKLQRHAARQNNLQTESIEQSNYHPQPLFYSNSLQSTGLSQKLELYFSDICQVTSTLFAYFSIKMQIAHLMKSYKQPICNWWFIIDLLKRVKAVQNRAPWWAPLALRLFFPFRSFRVNKNPLGGHTTKQPHKTQIYQVGHFVLGHFGSCNHYTRTDALFILNRSFHTMLNPRLTSFLIPG